jgi:hypothetical protein
VTIGSLKNAITSVDAVHPSGKIHPLGLVPSIMAG